jgi:hypothetical protein
VRWFFTLRRLDDCHAGPLSIIATVDWEFDFLQLLVVTSRNLECLENLNRLDGFQTCAIEPINFDIRRRIFDFCAERNIATLTGDLPFRLSVKTNTKDEIVFVGEFQVIGACRERS